MKSEIFMHRPKTQLLNGNIMGTSGNTEIKVNREATDNWKTRKDARSTRAQSMKKRRETKNKLETI